MKRSRCLSALLTGAVLLGVLAMPAAAADYDTTLDGLSRLQTLAQTYISENASDADPIEMTLSYTRTGVYNTDIWTITAGARDPGFESYVSTQDASLTALQETGVVETPGGSVDFAHLLASMNLVYRGLPISGSWGGDCMELAKQYAGQASDADGYTSLMTGCFDSADSMFGGDDLRADMDAIVIGAQLTADSSISDTIGSYYSAINDHDRAYQFIALSFGNVDTSNTQAFRQEVYETLTQDTGMQLLLYLNGMMDSESWTVSQDYQAPLQAACNVLADYLAQAVGGEKVQSDSGTLMKTMAAQALSDALSAMGDQQAADAVLSADQDTSSSSSSSASSDVSSVLSGAATSIQTGFNLQVFETVLLVIGAAAVMLAADQHCHAGPPALKKPCLQTAPKMWLWGGFLFAPATKILQQLAICRNLFYHVSIQFTRQDMLCRGKVRSVRNENRADRP